MVVLDTASMKSPSWHLVHPLKKCNGDHSLSAYLNIREHTHTYTHTHSQMRTALSKIIGLVQVYTFKEGMTSILHFEKNIHKSMAYMSLRIVLFWDLLKLFFSVLFTKHI